MKKLIIRLAVLVILLLILGGGGYLWWNDAISANDPADTATKIFIVSKGEGIKNIATRLKAESLIKDQIGFFLLVKLMGLDSKIQAGDFRLSRSMNAQTIAEELTHGSLDRWVTILEGWRNEEIAHKLAQELDIPEAEFLRNAQEGYMFPDTYLIPREASAAAIVEIFRNNFNTRVTPELSQQLIKPGLKDLNAAVVLASIVEREGNSESDRPVIASILLKRLNNDWPLQTDATLQYALGYAADEKSWWRKSIFNEDKALKSPYNTYAHPGLPPGPICNPGLSSLTAVAAASDTPYWYYLHDPQGGVHFAKTIDEHNANIRAFLQ